MFHAKNLCAFGSFLKILLLLNLAVTRAKGRACTGNTHYDLIQRGRRSNAMIYYDHMNEIRLLSLTEWYYLVRHLIAIVHNSERECIVVILWNSQTPSDGIKCPILKVVQMSKAYLSMDIPSIITPRIPRSYRRGSVHFLSFAPRVVSHKCLERGPRLKKVSRMIFID